MANLILGFVLRMKDLRIFLTRKVIDDGSSYFGPYTNIKTAYTLLELIDNLFPIRKSNYNFSEKIINDPKNTFYLNVLRKKGIL